MAGLRRDILRHSSKARDVGYSCYTVLDCFCCIIRHDYFLWRNNWDMRQIWQRGKGSSHIWTQLNLTGMYLHFGEDADEGVALSYLSL